MFPGESNGFLPLWFSSALNNNIDQSADERKTVTRTPRMSDTLYLLEEYISNSNYVSEASCSHVWKEAATFFILHLQLIKDLEQTKEDITGWKL